MKASQMSDNKIIETLRILKTAARPIVVNCEHESNRTEVTIAMYRIIFQDWNKDQTIEEIENGGYNYHWFYLDLITYVQNADINHIEEQVFK